MALIVTINGTQVGYIHGSLTINKNVPGPHIASFTIQSYTGAARPAKFQEVIFLDGATRRFGGLVDTVEETSIGGEPQTGYNEYLVNCTDFSLYADWRTVVHGGFVAGTPLAATALPALLGFLSPNGVTLDASGVSGAVQLPHSPYESRTIRSISDEISMLTGYAWQIDYNKVYTWFLPGTVGAPFDVTDTETRIIGDIRVEPGGTEYANVIYARLGSGAREVTDTFTGDGATSAFTINYFPLVASRGYVIDDINALPQEIRTLSIDAPGTATWDYTTATGVITRYISGTLTLDPLPNGQVANFIYTAQFPVVISADGATSPIIDYVLDLPTIFDIGAGQQAADITLVRMMATTRLVFYSTYTDGLEPGMFQLVTCTHRGLNNVAGYIQEVNVTHLEGSLFRYDVVWLEGLELQNTWRDIYREWSELGGGGGAATTTSTAPTPGSGAAPPVNAVQFNRAGALGGDAEFLYNEVTNSVVCGDGSSITAGNVQSCQIFGSNNHIADP